jgi:HAE1 family hydrophobic/amphiphilic exporter-1
MLIGLVGKNAILLVDYTNTLRQRGLPRREAILEAGFTRLRPILMTTATIIFAMTPLALKLEAGGESRAPLAVVLIGGVTSSTLLSLLLVPVMYTLLDDAKNLLAATIRWRPRRRVPQPATVPTPAPAAAHGSASASAHTSAFSEHRPIQGGSTDE